jgi:hypothetical protein
LVLGRLEADSHPVKYAGADEFGKANARVCGLGIARELANGRPQWRATEVAKLLGLREERSKRRWSAFMAATTVVGGCIRRKPGDVGEKVRVTTTRRLPLKATGGSACVWRRVSQGDRVGP